MLLPHASPYPNQYLPGLVPSGPNTGQPRTTVGGLGFWNTSLFEQMRGGVGEVYLPDLLRLLPPGPGGVVQVDLIDQATGEVLQRQFVKNIITDIGAIAMLKAFGNAAPTTAPFVAIDQSVAAANYSATVAPGAITTVPVVATSGGTAAGGNPTFQAANAASTFQSNASNTGIKQNNNSPTPNVGAAGTVVPGSGLDSAFGTGISLSYGTPNEEGVAGSTTANSTTSINVTAYTTTKTHTINDWVVGHGSTLDNPAGAPTGIAFSAAQSQVPSGANIGQRSTVYSYTFAAGVLSSSNPFTGLWLTTSITSGVGIWYARAAITPVFVSALAGVVVTYTVKV